MHHKEAVSQEKIILTHTKTRGCGIICARAHTKRRIRKLLLMALWPFISKIALFKISRYTVSHPTKEIFKTHMRFGFVHVQYSTIYMEKFLWKNIQCAKFLLQSIFVGQAIQENFSHTKFDTTDL